jgi:hypothetical protein
MRSGTVVRKAVDNPFPVGAQSGIFTADECGRLSLRSGQRVYSEGVDLGLFHWLTKKRGKKTPEIELITLPLTHKELIVLVGIVLGAEGSEQMNKADKELIDGVKNRVARWVERQCVDKGSPVGFIGLRLTLQELRPLVKNLARFRKSEQIAIADKVILDGVMDRLGRWAQRQGAWWDDGHKIITSLGQKID